MGSALSRCGAGDLLEAGHRGKALGIPELRAAAKPVRADEDGVERRQRGRRRRSVLLPGSQTEALANRGRGPVSYEGSLRKVVWPVSKPTRSLSRPTSWTPTRFVAPWADVTRFTSPQMPTYATAWNIRGSHWRDILAGYPGAVRCLTAEADDRGEPRAFRAHPGWIAERRQGFPGYGQAFLMRRSGVGLRTLVDRLDLRVVGVRSRGEIPRSRRQRREPPRPAAPQSCWCALDSRGRGFQRYRER